MNESFMTLEGDRSSVVPPSKTEKARNQIKATVETLHKLLNRWPSTDQFELLAELSNAKENIKQAMDLIRRD